jgi:hypothetical protein
MNYETALIGSTETEAQNIAEELGFTTRVMRRDGENYIGTMDFRTNRINLEITDGKVTAQWIG